MSDLGQSRAERRGRGSSADRPKADFRCGIALVFRKLGRGGQARRWARILAPPFVAEDGRHGATKTLSDRAGHVLTAAHGRLDLAVPVGTFRDVNGAAVRFGQRGVLKLLAALAAGHRPDAHATFLADIDSHVVLQGCEPDHSLIIVFDDIFVPISASLAAPSVSDRLWHEMLIQTRACECTEIG